MIIPSAKYPAQTAIDLTNYPQGKARNVTVSMDNTGTPFEASWINDWFGFQQAAVAAAGITPSGSPDTAVDSQLLKALVALHSIGAYSITGGVAKNSAQNFGLSTAFQYGGYTLASDTVTVPDAGWYRLAVSGMLSSTDTANPKPLSARIFVNGPGTQLSVGEVRYSATTSESFAVSGEAIVNITSPSTQGISLVSNSTALIFAASPPGMLVVERVG